MTKFKWKVKPGEEMPVVNRALHAMLISAIIYFIFFPATIAWGIFCLMIAEYTNEVFLPIIIFIAPFFVFSVYGFFKDKIQPSSESGTYRPGTLPNQNKFQSSKWYQHEAMMDRERQEEKRKRDSWHD